MLNFKKKLAFVLGGSGLIGKSVIKKLEKLECRTLNLDIRKSKKSKYDYLKFDCTNINVNIVNKLNNLFIFFLFNILVC